MKAMFEVGGRYRLGPPRLPVPELAKSPYDYVRAFFESEWRWFCELAGRLSPEQRTTFLEGCYFDVRGQEGSRFRIAAPDVFLMEDQNDGDRYVALLCVGPAGTDKITYPIYEVMFDNRLYVITRTVHFVLHAGVDLRRGPAKAERCIRIMKSANQGRHQRYAEYYQELGLGAR